MSSDSPPAAVSPQLVEAMVPQQILQEDEIVLLLTKPSLFFIFFDSFLFVAATLILGSVAMQLAVSSPNAYITPRLVAFITSATCFGRFIWSLLVWTSHVYMLTNLRIVTIKGVINVHMFQAQLRKIQKTELYRPLLQRLTSTGTLGFSTAAAAGNLESTWLMLSRPKEIHEQIIAAINKSQPK